MNTKETKETNISEEIEYQQRTLDIKGFGGRWYINVEPHVKGGYSIRQYDHCTCG
jgi:hypothetical protein